MPYSTMAVLACSVLGSVLVETALSENLDRVQLQLRSCVPYRSKLNYLRSFSPNRG